MQAGDPREFAVRLALGHNPHGENDRATKEDRVSWGSFTLYASGENLCAYLDYGESTSAAHWYLLPLIEWISNNWDALLHEERLPLRNVGLSAAESLAVTQTPPLRLKEVDEFEWLETWTAWWARHNIRAARTGGLFPDLYIRRYRDEVEISTGGESLPGVPEEITWLAPNRSYRLDLSTVIHVLHEVLTHAAKELVRRLPDSHRLVELNAALDDLAAPSRYEQRMAWLAGSGDDFESYSVLSDAVENALAGTPEMVRQTLSGSRGRTPLAVFGSSVAQLLFGAASPRLDARDVTVLTRRLIQNYISDSSPWLERLNLNLDTRVTKQLPPWEQGNHLGEQASELLATGAEASVDVAATLARLEISVSQIGLSDAELRAVTVFGPTQRPHIFCNNRFVFGTGPSVQRFSLAHELCHLLVDRERGEELAVASGPWAPVAVEQRANAFAAAFLMPTWLLRTHIAAVDHPLNERRTISRLARLLKVSPSSLVDRLYNLGELNPLERNDLRAVHR